MKVRLISVHKTAFATENFVETFVFNHINQYTYVRLIVHVHLVPQQVLLACRRNLNLSSGIVFLFFIHLHAGHIFIHFFLLNAFLIPISHSVVGVDSLVVQQAGL